MTIGLVAFGDEDSKYHKEIWNLKPKSVIRDFCK